MSTRQANSTLADLPLETEYRSDCHDLVRDFYLPCLQRSTQYRRAVGCFTRRGLSVAAQGLTALIHGGGRLLLAFSPLFAADESRRQVPLGVELR